MKLSILFVALLCGCSSIVSVERLSKQLSENNATFYIEVPTARGPIKIGRANSIIGFSSSAGPNGITQNSPTNLVLQIGYQLPIAPPTTPQTVQTNKVKP